MAVSVESQEDCRTCCDGPCGTPSCGGAAVNSLWVQIDYSFTYRDCGFGPLCTPYTDAGSYKFAVATRKLDDLGKCYLYGAYSEVFESGDSAAMNFAIGQPLAWDDGGSVSNSGGVQIVRRVSCPAVADNDPPYVDMIWGVAFTHPAFSPTLCKLPAVYESSFENCPETSEITVTFSKRS